MFIPSKFNLFSSRSHRRKAFSMSIAFLLMFLAADAALAAEPAAAADATAAKVAEPGVKVAIETSLGVIVVELNAEKAPLSVANFLTYVKSGGYDGTIFHRIISNFMIQGGGFTPDLERTSSNKPVQNEADNGLKNDTGTIAMARTAKPHSATNQFYINVQDNSSLNHRNKTRPGWGYAVFGKVVDGMSVVNAIKEVKTGACLPKFKRDCPETPVMILSTKILK